MNIKSTVRLHATFGGETIVECTGEPSVVIDGRPALGDRLLCLAAAGCYANTLLAEAMRRGIWVRSVDVNAELKWAEPSVRAQNVTLSVRVDADAEEPTIMELAEYADRANEVANSLRLGLPVRVANASVKDSKI
jgi:organic hydroperoxide reductase OsmC/OhrA